MTSSVCDEELLSSVATLSPPIRQKSGTLELPHTSDPINLKIIPTPKPTLLDVQSSSPTHTFVVHTQPIFSTLKTRRSLTPPPTNLQVTIDNVIYTVPSKETYNILEDPVSIDSGILLWSMLCTPTLKHTSHTNTMADQFLNTQLNRFLKLISFLYT